MSKKIIIAASIAGLLALGGGAFAIGRAGALSLPVSAEEDEKAARGILNDLKVGRYYREGGTEDEYIEVYDDGTLQMFGYSYYDEVCELNKDLLEEKRMEGDEAWLEDYDVLEMQYDDFWKARNKYIMSQLSRVVFFEVPKGDVSGGVCLTYTDENDLIFSEDRVYRFTEDVEATGAVSEDSEVGENYSEDSAANADVEVYDD